MRKIIISNFISLDGYFAGINGDLDWVTADEEHHQYSTALLSAADLLMFGRSTYEVFKAYWPLVSESPPTPQGEIEVAQKLNSIAKLVFSSSLQTTDWNTTVRRSLAPDEINEIKQQPGKNIVVFGSGMLAKSLIQYDLIDEYHLLIQPVALGRGKPMFVLDNARLNLKLTQTEPCASGVVRHYYVPDTKDIKRVNYSN